MRAEYLFPLAHVCHLTAPVVDQLTLSDFAVYIDSVDAYTEAMNRKE